MDKLDIQQVVQALDQVGAKKRFSELAHEGRQLLLAEMSLVGFDLNTLS